MNRLPLIPVFALLGVSFAFAGPKKPADAADDDCCAVVATCPVSGEELGSMGEAFVHVHREPGQPDREVKLCCEHCLPRFKKDPARYLAKQEPANDDCCAVEEAGGDPGKPRRT